jgi:hypothetical protein
MKNLKVTLILLFALVYKISFSQTEEWNTYDFDSIVSIDMPFDVYETDTIQDNRKLLQMFSSNDTVSFVAQKLYLGKLYSNIETEPLPHDNKSLEKRYNDIISVFIEGFPYELENTKAIKYYNLKGYKLLFKNKKGLPIQEINLIIVNKYLYNFSYTNINGLKEIDKKYFFESITFNKEKELSQFIKSPYSNYKIFILTLFIILLLSFFLRLKPKNKKQKND